jgi:hypothetical protein
VGACQSEARSAHLETLQFRWTGDPLDLAWAAGMFEGEGTITITRAGSRGYTRGLCTLTSTDGEVPAMFHDWWGGAVRSGQPKGNARPVRYWYITGDAMYTFLWQMRPQFRRPLVINRATAALAGHAARQQGNRHTETYGPLMQRFRHLMSVLNHRGTTPLAEPDARIRQAAEVSVLSDTPLQWPG